MKFLLILQHIIMRLSMKHNKQLKPESVRMSLHYLKKPYDLSKLE